MELNRPRQSPGPQRPSFVAEALAGCSSVGAVSGSGGFSFVANNLRRIADLPRYAWGAARAVVTRRRPNLWVIASHFGLADGAWAFDREVRRAHPEVRLVWLVSTAEQAAQAEAAGVEWCPRDSKAGMRLTLQAGAVVITHGFGDANRYGQSGAVIVQLWHGMPLKKLHADSPAVLNLGPAGAIPGVRALVEAMYRKGNSRISLLPVAAEPFVASMETAFSLPPGRVRVLGEPRTDVLFQGHPDERRAASRALLSTYVGHLDDSRLVLLFAPTWRDGEADPVVPTPDEWAEIEAYLVEVDGLLLVRPHPLGVGDYDYSSSRVLPLTSAIAPESMPLLWGVDALITDYSSMIFDFAVTGGPIVFLAPDAERYARTRGLYIRYSEITGGAPSRTWAEVVARLRDPDAQQRARAHSRALAERYHRHTDGRSAARVVARVRAMLS